MTNLKRPVRRVTEAESHPGWQVKSRPLIIILTPPDLITVKEKGRKRGYTLTVRAVYDMAVRAEGDRLAAEKRKRRSTRRTLQIHKLTGGV